MQPAKKVVALAVLLALPGVAAHGGTIGSTEAGRDYARAHCGECHAVELTGDMSPNYDAPRFVDVANTPGMTERALSVWLQTSHPSMPDLIIPEEQRDDLIVYIMSLKSAPPL